MRVQLAHPVGSGDQLRGYLQSLLPHREHFTRGGSACVGAGLMTGVVVKPDGPNAVSLGWEMPNLGVKLFMVLAIVAGILPGLLLWLIAWMVISGDVEALKQEVAGALTSGQPMQPGMAMAAAGAVRPSKPGGAAMVFGVLFTLGSLGLFAKAYDDFDRANRYENYPSYGSSYGSGYGSRYGSGSMWTYLARRRREEGQILVAAGAVGLLVAFALFAVRRSKVRAWEAQAAGMGPMMAGAMSMPPQQPMINYGAPQGFGMPPAPQGFGPPPQGYGVAPPQQGYGPPPQQPGYGAPPQQGYAPQQQGFGPPPSGPNPYGGPQGGWPPGGQQG